MEKLFDEGILHLWSILKAVPYSVSPPTEAATTQYLVATRELSLLVFSWLYALAWNRHLYPINVWALS